MPKEKKSELFQLQDGSGDVAVRMKREAFNEATCHVAYFLHNVPDVARGEVTRAMARDALMVLTGFTAEQLGQIAGAGPQRRLPGLGG